MSDEAIQYDFSKDWFNDQIRANFDNVFKLINPSKVLEIGCFEGASTCHIIDTLASIRDIDLHCIDTWLGSAEYQNGHFDDTQDIDMVKVERRFLANTQKAVHKATHKVQLSVHKNSSTQTLAKLIHEQHQFDFIYIDASHLAPDVLCDAVMGFQLLKVGGVMAFDDYLWFEQFDYGKNILRAPKIAIDAFTNIFLEKIEFFFTRSDQIYIRRIA